MVETGKPQEPLQLFYHVRVLSPCSLPWLSPMRQPRNESFERPFCDTRISQLSRTSRGRAGGEVLAEHWICDLPNFENRCTYSGGRIWSKYSNHGAARSQMVLAEVGANTLPWPDWAYGNQCTAGVRCPFIQQRITGRNRWRGTTNRPLPKCLGHIILHWPGLQWIDLGPSRRSAWQEVYCAFPGLMRREAWLTVRKLDWHAWICCWSFFLN